MNCLDYVLKINGVSNKELANKLGVSASLVTRWRSGERTIAKKHVSELETMFKVPSGLFLLGDLSSEGMTHINRLLNNEVTEEERTLQHLYSEKLLELHALEISYTHMVRAYEVLLGKHTKLVNTLSGLVIDEDMYISRHNAIPTCTIMGRVPIFKEGQL